MSRTVLIIAAHADDETIGCGGTIAKHVADGDEVHVVFFADGVTSRKNVAEQASLTRQDCSERALEILGISRAVYLGLPDNRLDSVPLLDIVQSLEVLIGELKPQIIYTHHAGDLNVDHRITHQAVMTACRPTPGFSVKEILSFEVLSSTEWSGPGEVPFLPSTFVDISQFLDKKLQACAAYDEEMREIPHSRSLEHVAHLARHRGYSMGVEAAEAFVTVRLIR